MVAPAFAIGAYRQSGDIAALYLGFAVMGIGLLYYYLAEVSEKITGVRPAQMASARASRLDWFRRTGLVASPFGLADFEAVYLIVFPLFGFPLQGMMVAIIGGALSRVATAAIVVSRLWRADPDAGTNAGS